MEESFIRWAVDGTIAVFAATPGWTAYVLHRRRTIANEAARVARVISRLNQIDARITAFTKAFQEHMEDDRRIARQVYAMRRDLDRDYVRQDRLDSAIKAMVDGLNRLGDRIDALHQRTNGK